LLGGYRGARDELIFAPLGSYLTSRGANIHTGVKLKEMHYDAPSNQLQFLVMDGDQRVDADIYVCALPVWSLAPLLPEQLQREPFFGDLKTLPVAPAIAVQLWFDRKVVTTSDFILVARS